MTLSKDTIFLYVLRQTGIAGRLTSGRLEPGEGGTPQVYDGHGKLNEYLSGLRLRSWSVWRYGVLLPEWTHIEDEDAGLMEKPR